MKITATIENSKHENTTLLSTNDQTKAINIAGRPNGGSSINGGELLFLALATCCCNDTYREAAKMNIDIDRVSVTVSGEFGGVGEPGRNITYSIKIDSPASPAEIEKLIRQVDQVAEVHNTLRQANTVLLTNHS